jgi:LmbE family N-acetylglucosaminyl deacetylase
MKQKKEVLVIVAHPDDETIWMGGTLLRHKDWKKTIISLCRRDDEDRAPKFRRVSEILKADCYMSDMEDVNLNKLSLNEVKKRIAKFSKKKYDYIFTHGENGEYGHLRHIETHDAVVEMLRNKKLKCKEIFFFSYMRKGREINAPCIPNPKSDKSIKLNDLEFKMKKYLIADVYGFNNKSFEKKSCKKKESFNLMKLK